MTRKIGSFLLIILPLIALGAGCATGEKHMWAYPHADYVDYSQKADDHRQSIIRVADHDRRALIEDLDYFFMTDRPSRLTRWHVR